MRCSLFLARSQLVLTWYYSGLAPKTISSQDGTDRRERLLDRGVGVAGLSGEPSCFIRSSTWAVGMVGAL